MSLKADEGRAVGSWLVLSRLAHFVELLVNRDDAKGVCGSCGLRALCLPH